MTKMKDPEKKNTLPPRPALCSIDMNRIIRAVNDDKPNPCTENEEQIAFYNAVMDEKRRKPGIYFDLVESDYYEDCFLDSLIPD